MGSPCLFGARFGFFGALLACCILARLFGRFQRLLLRAGPLFFFLHRPCARLVNIFFALFLTWSFSGGLGFPFLQYFFILHLCMTFENDMVTTMTHSLKKAS